MATKKIRELGEEVDLTVTVTGPEKQAKSNHSKPKLNSWTFIQAIYPALARSIYSFSHSAIHSLGHSFSCPSQCGSRCPGHLSSKCLLMLRPSGWRWFISCMPLTTWLRICVPRPHSLHTRKNQPGRTRPKTCGKMYHSRGSVEIAADMEPIENEWIYMQHDMF